MEFIKKIRVMKFKNNKINKNNKTQKVNISLFKSLKPNIIKNTMVTIVLIAKTKTYFPRR